MEQIVYLYIYIIDDCVNSTVYEMSVKRAVRQQYQAVTDRAAASTSALPRPSEGWLRTARKALGMSGAQLARRMGVTRARVTNLEQAELDGGVTLRSMQVAAEAMGCRFVYAVVPSGSVDDVILAQARRKARAIVGTTSLHMALESQGLSDEKIAREIARLTSDILHEMPSDLWDDA